VAKIRLVSGVDLDQVAGLTTGFTGADLANRSGGRYLAAQLGRRMAMEGREAVSVLLPASFEQLPMPAQLGGRNAEFQRKSPVDAVMRHGPRTERFALLAQENQNGS
jgi:hypothetical protein